MGGRLFLFGQETAGLPRPEAGKQPAGRHELVKRAFFDDTSTVQNHDPVHLRNGGKKQSLGSPGFSAHGDQHG